MPMPADTIVAAFGDLAERADLTVLLHPTVEEQHAALADAELVLGSWQGTRPLPLDAAAVAVTGPGVAFVQQPSAGTDSVDLDAFAARGVPVANTAGANARSVAEWTIGATLSLSRSIGWADAQIQAGGWPQHAVATRGLGEIGTLRVGVVGFGAVGSLVAQLYSGFGCDVAYWTRRPRPEATFPWLELSALCARSDVLVLCVPLTPETAGLIDAEKLAAISRGGYLIDVSRGGVLDQDALLAAVESGHLGGAAVDVHPQEPMPAGHPLLGNDRILLSAHSAAATPQAVARVIEQSMANFRRVIDGEPVIDVVNGVEPKVRRRT